MNKWQNAKGSRTVFSIAIADETAEMQLIAFNEDCEKFYPKLNLKKIYDISMFRVMSAENCENTLEIRLLGSTQI